MDEQAKPRTAPKPHRLTHRIIEYPTPFYCYPKDDNPKSAMLNREFRSFQAAATMVSDWIFSYEQVQSSHSLKTHTRRVLEATGQLASLASVQLTLWSDYVSGFHYADDCTIAAIDGVHNFLSPTWTLFHPLPPSNWPKDPAIAPFAVMGGEGLYSPVPLRGLVGYQDKYPPRIERVTVSERFLRWGGWARLKQYAVSSRIRLNGDGWIQPRTTPKKRQLHLVN